MLLQHNVLLCNMPVKGALQCDLMIATEYRDQTAAAYVHTHTNKTHTKASTSMRLSDADPSMAALIFFSL